MLTIPFEPEAYYTFSTYYNQRTYRLTLRYSTLAGRYFADINIDGDTVRTSVPVLLNQDLLRGLDSDYGRIYCGTPTDNVTDEPSTDNVTLERREGVRDYYLYWFTKEEVQDVLNA